MLIRVFSRLDYSGILRIFCFLIILPLFISTAVFAVDPATPDPSAPNITGTTSADPTATGSAVTNPTAAAATKDKTSWLGFLAKGGLTMVPIALCSVGFIAIVAAKFSIFRLMRFGINSFSEALTVDVSSGRIDQAIARCEKVNNHITRPLKKGLMVYRNEPSRTGDALKEAMLDEIPSMEAYIGWLGIIAGVSPLLGLYGTVVGVIEAFIQLAAGGAVTDPASFTQLSDAIYKALITTAAGLFVGIPAFVMYEYFRMKVTDMVRDMDRVSVSLLNALGIGLGGQI